MRLQRAESVNEPLKWRPFRAALWARYFLCSEGRTEFMGRSARPVRSAAIHFMFRKEFDGNKNNMV